MLILADDVQKVKKLLRDVSKTSAEIADQLEAWKDPSEETAMKTLAAIESLLRTFSSSCSWLADVARQSREDRERRERGR